MAELSEKMGLETKKNLKNEPNSIIRLDFFSNAEIICIGRQQCPYEPCWAKIGGSMGV